MLSENEQEAIEYAKTLIDLFDKGVPLNYLEEENNIIKILLNLITKLQKENEHQTEKINNQKCELAVLNEKQKEMNKLINIVSSYKAMFKKQQKEMKKKDKIIDLMAERIEWLCKSNGILLDREHDENFTQEDIKQYFERKCEE